MVETKFKPSLKIEKTFIVIGLVLLITIILFPIGMILIFTSLASMINKHFTTYIINNQNEVLDNYDFISKSSRVYRIDQITSLTLSQSFLEKIFNLGSIQFGIFGKSGIYAGKQNIKNPQSTQIGEKLLSLENYKNKFSQFSQLISLNPEESVYIDKPSRKPIKFWMAIWFSSFIISFLGLLLFSFEIGFIFFIISVISIIFFIFAFIINLKLISTKYSISKNYIKYEYDYFLGSRLDLVPFKKITNSEINKNLISYSLFKIGYLKIFTGGSNDPLFDSLENFETFNNHLDNLLQISKGNIQNKQELNNTNNETIQNKQELNNNNNKKVLFETRPGVGFFMTYSHLLFFIFCLLTLVLIPIYIIYLIFKLILWRNTKYIFYNDRVVDISGVINITQKEIYFRNIKHIKLERKFLFEKLFDQGTIYIYTPGTGRVDNKINSIKNYKEVYDDFKEVIL